MPSLAAQLRETRNKTPNFNDSLYNIIKIGSLVKSQYYFVVLYALAFLFALLPISDIFSLDTLYDRFQNSGFLAAALPFLAITYIAFIGLQRYKYKTRKKTQRYIVNTTLMLLLASFLFGSELEIISINTNIVTLSICFYLAYKLRLRKRKLRY